MRANFLPYNFKSRSFFGYLIQYMKSRKFKFPDLNMFYLSLFDHLSCRALQNFVDCGTHPFAGIGRQFVYAVVRVNAFLSVRRIGELLEAIGKAALISQSDFTFAKIRVSVCDAVANGSIRHLKEQTNIIL